MNVSCFNPLTKIVQLPCQQTPTTFRSVYVNFLLKIPKTSTLTKAVVEK